MAFHAQDDLWFKRMKDGSVHVKWDNRTTVLAPESWASVVACMSAAGGSAETWRAALQRQTVRGDLTAGVSVSAVIALRKAVESMPMSRPGQQWAEAATWLCHRADDLAAALIARPEEKQ